MTDVESARRDWSALLGESSVWDAAQAQRHYGADTGGAERHLAGALQVQAAHQVPELLRIAQRTGAPVHPISTGRNWGYGSSLPIRDGCHILDLSGLRQIRSFDPELGVVTVEPGVTQGMLYDFLTQNKAPFLVPVTGAGPTCSLVGNALERGYGITPIADHFAAVTDAEVVLANGTVHHSLMREWGGADIARLYRWGIGPYLTGLFSQSNLGVVTSLSIALARRPARVEALLFSLPDDSLLEPCVAVIQSALSTLHGIIGGVNLMNRHRVLAMTAPYPKRELRDANGLIPPALLSTMGRQFQVAPWTGLVTLYGSDAVVRAARSEIKRMLRPMAIRRLSITPKLAQSLARWTRHLPGAWGQRLASTTQTLAKSLQLVDGQPNETALPLAYWRSGRRPPTGDLNPARDGCGLRWFAPLVPMRSPVVRQFVDGVHAATAQYGIEPLVTLTSVGDRLFDSTVPILFDRNDAVELLNASHCHVTLLKMARELGCMPYRLGADDFGIFNQLAAPLAARSLMEGLRATMDPAGVLSPGKFSSH